MQERELKRYAAYFRGWCQAFGEHEGIHGEESGIDWLIADCQMGLVLPRDVLRTLRREVLLHAQPPALVISGDHMQVGSLEIPMERGQEPRILDVVREIVRSDREVHVFLTSHLLYGGGNRIITISGKKPLAIIYKEIGTMRLQLTAP
ncbi:MAG: hypothetical protein PVG42_09425 [Lysobacterales bacterium]|jgi:hypothetical protein